VRDGRLSFFRSEQIVLVVHTQAAAYKICRLSFGADGSIYVSFPYCREKKGILNFIERKGPGPQTIDLSAGGRPVSTDVKFSHHTSGIVQLGKTNVLHDGPRRTSFRLDGPIGFLFDLHVFRPDGFDGFQQPRRKDLALGFHFAEGIPSAVHINAQWRRRRDILANARPAGGSVAATTTVMHRASGRIHPVYFVGQPARSPLQQHVIMLSGGAVPLPAGADRSGMVFLGGWNPHESTPDGNSVASHGLVFMYPAGPPEDTPEVAVARRRRVPRWVVLLLAAAAAVVLFVLLLA
jgi:hypothetical protein